MPTQYNLFGLGQQNKSSNISAAHRLNCYYDVRKQSDKNLITAYGTPGLDLFTYITGSPTIGIHWAEAKDYLFVVQGKKLYQVYRNGTFLEKGTLTELPALNVSMANNGTQLAIFDGVYAYIYNMDTGVFTDISGSLPWVTTPGVELAGNSVTFLDGMFIALRPATGQFYHSDLYNGLVWGALNFATAESNPDQLVSVVADKGNLALLGYTSIEIWSNVGDVDFPFQRINSSPNEGGLAARWSLAKCKGSVTGLFRNRSGALSVCILNGYELQPLSDSDMDYIFNKYASPSDAIGFSYTLSGKAFYQISFVRADQTWLYDFDSGCWSQLQSYGHKRHIGNMGAAFDDKILVTGYNDGSIYVLNEDSLTDNGVKIVREITGTHFFRLSQNYIAISRLKVDLETGSYAGTETPQMMLQISRDGGHSWGRELWTSMGKVGEYGKIAEFRRLGMAKDWLFKIRVSDNIKFAIINAVVEGEELS